MRILIADDSALLRRRLVELLCELEGVEVVGEAQGAEAASAAVRSLRPDVLTLDIRMPDGNGIELLRQVKREGLAPVVIILTNHASPPYRSTCMVAGADYFIDKATEITRVKGIIEGLLPRFSREGV